MSGIFDRMAAEGHEQVFFCSDEASKLRMIIAIHDTTLGPALGGCRMYPYESEDEALEDALRLSKGMTYKSAATGQDHGGGKAVIWGEPERDKSEALFRAAGRFIAGLRGRFVTGNDVGTVPTDFVWAAKEGRYFVALPPEHGGSGDSGPITAYGVWRGMKACAREVWGEDSLAGRHVAVQGVGKVGARLVEHLVEEGARVTVSDVSEAQVARLLARFPSLEVVPPETVIETECDIFSPCALGGVLNEATIPRLRCRVVAGSANNQLRRPDDARRLAERGILYAPDYVINAGGLIQVADELLGYDRARAYQKATQIELWLARIFALARETGVSTADAADRLAEERIALMAALAHIHLPAR